MSTSRSSSQDDVDKLDIRTITADRRAIMLRYLNTVNNNNSSGEQGGPSWSSEDRDSVGEASNTSNTSGSSRSAKGPGSLFRFFKRRKGSGSTSGDSRGMEEVMVTTEAMASVIVRSLPQLGLVKYLGSRPADGVRDIRAVRGPIDKLFEAVSKMKEGEDLPLVNLTVSEMGFRMECHVLNRASHQSPIVFPIESVSYGVQDAVYCRVFCFIQVPDGTTLIGRHPSSSPHCHVFVCPNPQTARKLALSLQLAYGSLQRRLSGAEVYSLDLRTADQLTCRIPHRDEVDA